MKNDLRSSYLAREQILALLSDDENARVSTAQSAPKLTPAAEYLDLTHLELGVQKADGAAIAMGRTLPRSAVSEATWSRILGKLAEFDRAR